MWVPVWIVFVLGFLFCAIAAFAIFALIGLWRAGGQIESERAAAARDRATFWGAGS